MITFMVPPYLAGVDVVLVFTAVVVVEVVVEVEVEVVVAVVVELVVEVDAGEEQPLQTSMSARTRATENRINFRILDYLLLVYQYIPDDTR